MPLSPAITQYVCNENATATSILLNDECLCTLYPDLYNTRKPIVVSFEYYASSISYFLIHPKWKSFLYLTIVELMHKNGTTFWNLNL